MRLKAFRVTDYKTIEDSGRVEADPHVTCLLGKNEAGKSAVMQALWKFKNVAEAKYDPLFDLPAERFVELRHQDPEVVHLEFLLENGDKATFTKDFGDVVATPEKVDVRSTYAGKPAVEVALIYTPARYSSITHHVHSALAVRG